jgi:hypothetical protein
LICKSEPIKAVRTHVFPAVAEVRIYQDTIEHIRKNHPEIPVELPSFQQAIENALIQPSWIESSRPNTDVFVDRRSANKSGDPLRVPVKIVSGTSGRLLTAFFASSPGQSVLLRKDEDDEG